MEYCFDLQYRHILSLEGRINLYSRDLGTICLMPLILSHYIAKNYYTINNNIQTPMDLGMVALIIESVFDNAKVDGESIELSFNEDALVIKVTTQDVDMEFFELFAYLSDSKLSITEQTTKQITLIFEKQL